MADRCVLTMCLCAGKRLGALQSPLCEDTHPTWEPSPPAWWPPQRPALKCHHPGHWCCTQEVQGGAASSLSPLAQDGLLDSHCVPGRTRAASSCPVIGCVTAGHGFLVLISPGDHKKQHQQDPCCPLSASGVGIRTQMSRALCVQVLPEASVFPSERQR